MRYRCPDDCAGLSHAGMPLVKEADGTIEAAAEDAAALAPHGLVPVAAKVAAGDTPSGRGNRDDRRMLR